MKPFFYSSPSSQPKVVNMAIPWYSPEIPTNSSETNLEIIFSPETSTMNRNNNSTAATNNKKNIFSMNSVRNIIIKSNNLFKNHEPDVNKISTISPGEDDGHHNHRDNNSDYSGHNFYHTGVINKAFLPMRLALLAVGRWPFAMRLTPVTSRARRRIKLGYHHHSSSSASEGHLDDDHVIRRHFVTTKVKNYKDTLKSPLWIYFGLTTLFVTFVLTMSTVGFFDFFLEWNLFPSHHWTSVPDDIFEHNLVVFLLVWGCLVHSAVSSISFFVNRKKIVKILNFWNVAADELLIDQIKRHRRFLIMSNIGYILFLFLIYFAYSKWNIELIKEGAHLFGILAIRPMLSEEEIEGNDNLDWELKVFGIVTIIYAIYASRALLIVFSFHCRVLRSMFTAWNTRLVNFLAKPENKFNEEKPETYELLEKMECQRLLSDLTILLKMVKQMDKMFAAVLQAYYAVQLLNMCFELYMLAKSGSKEFTRNDSNRGLDIATAVLTLCQNVYFFFTVSLDGAYVGEEADKGHDALRRHPISPTTSVHKKYLVYNLSLVYNKRIVLTGGKFFMIDRPFIIAVLGAVLTYFVIILQVQPSLEKNRGEA